ncbi:MAG TPA: hypothetical protein VMW25_00330 [Clostridia bacterium]|nr:hypothetical protein [Clostridia bacterium]
MRKSKRQKWLEQKAKEYKTICRSLGMVRVIKKYGLSKVTWAMARFVDSQRQIARLRREADELKNKLAEVEKKIK